MIRDLAGSPGMEAGSHPTLTGPHLTPPPRQGGVAPPLMSVLEGSFSVSPPAVMEEWDQVSSGGCFCGEHMAGGIKGPWSGTLVAVQFYCLCWILDAIEMTCLVFWSLWQCSSSRSKLVISAANPIHLHAIYTMYAINTDLLVKTVITPKILNFTIDQGLSQWPGDIQHGFNK